MTSSNKYLIQYEQLITDSILKYINPLAIILYGGYGRNEGGWIVDSDGIYKPYNDFDIALVFDKKIGKTFTNKIATDIKSKIDIRWVDISEFTVKQVSKLKNSIFSYDLKNGSKVIYGNGSIIKTIPHFDSKSIPYREIDILYKTRLWTILGSLDEKGVQSLTGEKSRFFRNQMSKCILAIVDSVLVINHDYNERYSEKVKIFEKYCEDNRLITLIHWALKEKYLPQDIEMSEDKVNRFYLEIIEYYLKYFYSSLSIYYGTAVKSYKDIKKIFSYNIKNVVRMIYKNKIIFSRYGSKEKYMNICQDLLANYQLSKNIELLPEIYKYSKKLSIYDSNIDVIRTKIAKRRINL